VARAAVARRAPKPPAAPPAPKPWDFIEPALPPSARRPVPAVLPVANVAPAPKPWDFVDAARPAARPTPVQAAQAMHEP
jgi:hypothetical protein